MDHIFPGRTKNRVNTSSDSFTHSFYYERLYNLLNIYQQELLRNNSLFLYPRMVISLDIIENLKQETAFINVYYFEIMYLQITR